MVLACRHRLERQFNGSYLRTSSPGFGFGMAATLASRSDILGALHYRLGGGLRDSGDLRKQRATLRRSRRRSDPIATRPRDRQLHGQSDGDTTKNLTEPPEPPEGHRHNKSQ